MKAMKARAAVLRTAQRVQIHTSPAYDTFRRFYTKTGGYAQAKKDFYSFESEPAKIRHYSLPSGVRRHIKYQVNRGATFPVRLHVRIVKTQISMRTLVKVTAVHLKTLWVLGYPTVTKTLIRLRIYNLVGNFATRLKCMCCCKQKQYLRDTVDRSSYAYSKA